MGHSISHSKYFLARNAATVKQEYTHLKARGVYLQMLPSDRCKHTGVIGMSQENQTSYESKFCCFGEAHRGEHGTDRQHKILIPTFNNLQSSPQGYLHNSTVLDKVEW